MTGSRDFKRLVRKRMAETGESYTVARSHFEAPTRKPSSKKNSSARLTGAAFKKEIYGRRRTNEIAAHLEKHYGIDCSKATKLDVGVYRIDRGPDPSWVARIFPAARSIDSVHGDAEILDYLERQGFPAERLAHPAPVSLLAGQPVLVTEYSDGSSRRSDATEETLGTLGTLLGRLNSMSDGPDACMRSAGSWHHLSVNGGGRRGDVDRLTALFDDARTRLSRDELPLLKGLRDELGALDDCDDLPKAFVHPDPCGANLLAWTGDDGVLVDWTGAGNGPRLLALTNLIGSVTSLAMVDAAVQGFRQYSTLTKKEIGRLEHALVGFPLILDCWMVLFKGQSLEELMKRLPVHRQRAQAIAGRARSAFAATLSQPATPEPDERQSSLFD
ncbi:MAG: aminoglycoside phosphotransferase family protein [Actinomycetota bacterium]